MHAFHVDVPAGTTALHLQFEFVTPVVARPGTAGHDPGPARPAVGEGAAVPGRVTTRVASRSSRRLTLPAGWQYATALEGARRHGDIVTFAPVSLERLVDSPLFAGPHYRRVELDPNPQAPVRLNVFADRPAELRSAAGAARAAPPHGARGARAVRLASLPPLRFPVRDQRPVRRRSASSTTSRARTPSGSAISPTGSASAPSRDLLPHEFVHSWNGKFRRPADLWTPSYEVPLQIEPALGLRRHDRVLGHRARRPLRALEPGVPARHARASTPRRSTAVARGREWRNLQDTTQQPIISYRGTQSYPSWQRGKDYYTEGALLWLDVDTRIRELTRGQRSLDDFARAFFGVEDGRIAPLTYTFEDVVAALAAVAPFDWAALPARAARRPRPRRAARGPRARRLAHRLSPTTPSEALRRHRRGRGTRQLPVLARSRARQVRHGRRKCSGTARRSRRASRRARSWSPSTGGPIRRSCCARRSPPPRRTRARRIALLLRRATGTRR